MNNKKYVLKQWAEDSLEYKYPNGSVHNHISTVLKQIENDLNELYEENRRIKLLIDKKLENTPQLTLTEKWKMDCEFKHSCRENHEKNIYFSARRSLLLDLKKELDG